MNNPICQNSSAVFDEVAIADLKHFQIAVLTTSKAFNRHILSACVPVARRFYQTQGWLIHNYRMTACLSGLVINTAFSENSSFKPIRRLAPSVPISFEVKSHQPLPEQILSQATFVCKLPNTGYSHHAVFRRKVPRFVRVYPFELGNSLLEKVAQMLADENVFISQNYERLRQVPFYQDNFGL